jgi:hypothetical protein
MALGVRMMIKTGSWFGELPPDHIRIGISRGVPRRMVPGYRMFRALAPGPWFNSLSTEAFIERYQTEVLDRLDPLQVLDRIQRLADARIPVLCCFERVGGPQWCHRSQAASWLAQSLGIGVQELGYEDQALHPLRPPETLV